MVYLDTFLHGDEVAAFFVMLMSHIALLYSTNKKTRHQHHYTTWRVSHTRKILNLDVWMMFPSTCYVSQSSM